MHYEQARAGKIRMPVLVRKGAQGCFVPGCESAHSSKGYCSLHYQRIYSGRGIPLETPRLRGVGYTNQNGYRVVSVDGKERLEHRVFMEEALGRDLLPAENVHHRNGVRDDNRPENLELWSTSQPAGQRVEDKLAWALEIVNLYGEGKG